MAQGTSGLPEIVNSAPIYYPLLLRNLLRYPSNSGFGFFGRHSLPSKSVEDRSYCGLLYYLNQAGFTLIELLIATAMVGILAAIAVPNVLTELPKFRLNGATQQIFGDLMAARMKAVSKNRKVKIFLSGDGLYKICDDADNNGNVDDCEGDSRITDLQSKYKGVTLSSTNKYNPIFKPNGTVSNLTTITVKNSSGSKDITIAITGRLLMK